MGIYYADLYPLLLPVHKSVESPTSTTFEDTQSYVVTTPPAIQTVFHHAGLKRRPRYPEASHLSGAGPSQGYGAIPGSPREDAPLLPSHARHTDSLSEAVATRYIPFWSVFAWLFNIITFQSFRPLADVEEEEVREAQNQPAYRYGHGKSRPRIAGGGANLPLLVIAALSEWIALLDTRGTGGSFLGSMMGCLQGFESDLADLERILTTPLPIIYAAHLRHTVWIYLFFLPFQLIDPLGYLAVLAVALAAFLYLGFLAAAEEVEQPFGYEENDLDLDMLIRDIIHVDIQATLARGTPNSSPASASKEAGEPSQGSIADACKLQDSLKVSHDDPHGQGHGDDTPVMSAPPVVKKEQLNTNTSLPVATQVTIQPAPTPMNGAQSSRPSAGPSK